MAEKIEKEILDQVCILAKLALSGEEKQKAGKEMQTMLDYVEKLNELNTEGVEPMSHVFSRQNVFREDERGKEDSSDGLLWNAPQKKEGQFKVPKTIG